MTESDTITRNAKSNLAFTLMDLPEDRRRHMAQFYAFCRIVDDIVDEPVMEKEERRAYSTALLRCSVRHRAVAACPLAFGETGVKSRIKAVMNYKKPSFWIVLLAVAAAIIAAICLLTVPKRHIDNNKAAGDKGDETVPAVWQWFDYLDTPSEMESDLTLELPIFPGTTFRYTTEEIIAEKQDGSSVSLIQGMPIWNAYFCDVTGDGVPDLCATYSFGFGMIDTRFICCDYQNGASYEMSDRGVYD